MKTSEGKIWIITGPRGAGKTRFCSRLAISARRKGLVVKGIVCPPEFAGKEKTGILLEDLQSETIYPLAKAITRPGCGGEVTDHWAFDEVRMEWSNQLLAGIQACDLVILDELGPLEFKLGKGWQNGLKLLDEGQFETALVVIRPELVETALKRWPQARIMEIPEGLEEDQEQILQDTIFSN